MTVCPIAIVAGCAKCPAFTVCPLKTVLGDQPSASDAKTEADNGAAKKPAKAKK